MVDILAVGGDEGRLLDSDKLRGAVKYALIRRFPNGVTPLLEKVEIRIGSEPRELKHLSTSRKINQ